MNEIKPKDLFLKDILIWIIEPPQIPSEPPAFPLPKVEEDPKAKVDPKKAAPAKAATGKDKAKEE